MQGFSTFFNPVPKELETQLFGPNVSSLQQRHQKAILSKFKVSRRKGFTELF